MHSFYVFFFFNDTATTEIYTLSLHDALPISGNVRPAAAGHVLGLLRRERIHQRCLRGELLYATHNLHNRDRKSTRLNSSHMSISYAVFCLKKKKKKKLTSQTKQ